MGVATASEEDDVMIGHHMERRILTEHPRNVLVEGTAVGTDAALRLLQPHIREPIVWHQPSEPLDLPSGKTHALVLRDAAALSGDDQRRLLAWMDTGSCAQVITAASYPLFPLVEAGLFDAALYYRLNVLLLRVDPPVAPTAHASFA